MTRQASDIIGHMIQPKPFQVINNIGEIVFAFVCILLIAFIDASGKPKLQILMAREASQVRRLI